MPKKSPIDIYAKKDLDQHLAAVEKSLFDLDYRLQNYFAGRENIRERFSGIVRNFKTYAADCRKEVERRLKKDS
jgi:hypothetical protein